MELDNYEDCNGSADDIGTNCDAVSCQSKITLTNPGIISRLRQDIIDYLSPFGYRLTLSTESAPSKDGVNIATAVLTVPILSNNSPIKTLHIHNHDENLIPSIGPLLRTYLRLSDTHIHPKQLRAIVDCQFIMRPNDSMTNQLEQDAAKRMAHHIHMLIRNSMGSALCLDLVVVLPVYSIESRCLSTLAIANAMENNSDTRYPCVTLKEREFAKFDDTSSALSGSDNIIKRRNLTQDGNTLHLHICSRMCTVRHQPALFRWLYTSSLPSLPVASKAVSNEEVRRDSLIQQSKSLLQPPIMIACIEKVANLHRILMLCYDYDKDHSIRECAVDDGAKDVSFIVSDSPLLMLNIVVVMPIESFETGKSMENNIVCGVTSISRDTKKSIIDVNSNRKAHKSLLEYFEEAIDHFHSIVFGRSKSTYKFYRPKLIYEDEVVKSLCPILSNRQQHKTNSSDILQPTIVGVDLHPNALTLCGDYAISKQRQRQHLHCQSGLKQTHCVLKNLQNAQAIAFGYESIGIPDCICSLLNMWVQIPCRSSINVVATMSIIFDALFGQ